MTMLVGGIIVLVAAFAPTSADAVIPNSALVPAGPASFNLNCTDNNDPTTATILAGIPGLLPLILPATINTNAIDSPANGESFTLDVTWGFTLPASLVSIAQATGNTTLVQTDTTLTMEGTSGATGTSAPTDPGPTTVNLPPATQPAVDVPFQSAPVPVTFTRTGTGTPVVLSPVSSITTSTAGSIPLLLRCTPTGDVTPLTLNDQEGPPPESTTSTVSTLPLVTTTTAPAAVPTTAGRGGTGGGSGAGSATTTRSTPLARTGFHSELLYLGIALLGAGYALSMAGRRVARASAGSR